LARELPAAVDVAVVGAGFAGLGMAVKLRAMGVREFVVLERADDIGGTWRDNVYPGAICDVPSHLYSFSFAPNPDWTRSFSPQSEIQAYLRTCATAHGLWPHIALRHEVTGADWDPVAGNWRVSTAGGSLRARVLVLAVGALSEPRVPALPGLAEFAGTVFHSADWDGSRDLAGARVAVIGTGASAVQIVPAIQPRVEHLTLFQRTPAWVVPHWNRRITSAERWAYRHAPVLQSVVRSTLYWSRESYAIGFTRRPGMLGVAERMARRHLERQVPDPELRAKLTPDFRIGCKRILLSNEYYPAITRPNVTLATGGAREVRPNGVLDASGVEHPVDTIVFATGFRVTDMPAARWLRGRDGQSLGEAWADGMHAYRGTTVPGFPNLFLLVGPNTGTGHTSQVFMIEAQLDYIVDAIRTLRAGAVRSLEVRADVEQRYVEQVQRRMSRTVWKLGGCSSWYLDPAGRNTTLWPDFTYRFRWMLRRFDPAAYHVVADESVPQPTVVAGDR
jgi:cation diffusion facilitator CzcD-associated flavoprotein CzcO